MTAASRAPRFLTAGLLFCSILSCARVPPQSWPHAAPQHIPDATGRDRIAVVFDETEFSAEVLTRRAPNREQCLVNPLVLEYRRDPTLLLNPAPPLGAPQSTSLDDVLSWALDRSLTAPALPPAISLEPLIRDWSQAAYAARTALRDAASAWNPDELSALVQSNRIGTPPPGSSAEQSARFKEEAEADRTLACRIANEWNPDAIRNPLAALWVSVRHLQSAAALLPAEAWPVGSPLTLTTSEGFVVVIGTLEADTVEDEWHLWLDPGGSDDVNATAPDTPWDVQCAVDLGGDDLFHVAEGRAGIGGALLGLSVFIDAEGDDAYEGGQWSVGAAAFGGGLFLDESGDDAYAAQRYSQGAAVFGIGISLDVAGRDVYTVGLQGQAFSGPFGFAVLWDGAGDDSYIAGGVAADAGRLPQHSLSMAQGCAFGLLPDAEGGTAILLDASGDDRYSAEVFGQGVGYWGGLGVLWDLAGTDTYTAVQYAQGAGLHFGVGVLRDDSGNDTYGVWVTDRTEAGANRVPGGLAMGCGHDLGIGVCIDAGGDDTYTAGGLAGGASSAGGLGLFIDEAGEDRYALTPVSNLGCDGSTEDRPGAAVFLDGAGYDQYVASGVRDYSSGPARNGARWRNGLRGVAVDLPISD